MRPGSTLEQRPLPSAASLPRLPDSFMFSQGVLQDYVDCPRRFQLRHVLMQPWPALITDSPVEFERHVQRGRDFHHLAHQHALGIDPECLADTISDPTLKRWWSTYLTHPPSPLPESVRRAEVQITVPLAGFRLAARYDLVAVDPADRLIVVDWKTAFRKPRRAVLAKRLQTRVYRYAAVEASAALCGGVAQKPEQIEMVYWFAAHGGITERFPYDADQYASDRDYLASVITEISACRESVWPLTTEQRQCRFCRYRSLCERGVQAGFLEDLDDDPVLPEPEIDLEQVAEIEF